VARSGKTGATIDALKRSLARTSPSSTDDSDVRAARVLLALIVDGQGKTAIAESQWSSLAGKPELDVAAAPLTLAPDASGESGR
jgi:hypothetical protein